MESASGAFVTDVRLDRSKGDAPCLESGTSVVLLVAESAMLGL